jgi:hypothetical protein
MLYMESFYLHILYNVTKKTTKYYENNNGTEINYFIFLFDQKIFFSLIIIWTFFLLFLVFFGDIINLSIKKFNYVNY